jgi:8-oxo-dGTP pyrophosphatase MutT (NUDIX family)
MTKEEVLKLYPDVYINEGGDIDTFREGEPIVERDPIAVIIQHPTDDLYLIARWSNGWCGFLTGGIESGDSLEDTVRKEILEETGYKHISLIQPMDCVSHGLFFHIVKHQNRLAHYHLVFTKLADLEQQEISEEEQAIATFTWIHKDRVKETLKEGAMGKLWDFYLKSDIF